MEGVPLKMPQVTPQEIKEDVKVAIPDYLNILQEAEYEFSLENWVLTGLQSGFTSPLRSQLPSSSSELQASCPPYWMMFSSPQQSRLASRHSSDFWEPNPRQRSHSLNLIVLRTKFTISDSDEEEERPVEKAAAPLPEKAAAPLPEKAAAPLPEKACSGGGNSPAPCQRGQRRAQKAFVPDFLNPPACLSSLPHQRRKNLRQYSLSDSSKQDDPKREWSKSPLTRRNPNTRASTIDHTSNKQKLTHLTSLNPYCGRSLPVTSHTTGLPSSGADSSTELLSALSPEERELLGAITARGYPLRTAIIALQKTGQQPPEQILSYLVACDHLCQLGHDMAQVEEALEMFQNCETKAEEFLHLLSQFNEMGFQQNAIKEVLLVHENNHERALEELMMRVA